MKPVCVVSCPIDTFSGYGARSRDFVKALIKVMMTGKISESYNIGGNNEKTNLEVINMICSILDELVPENRKYNELITFVADRPGHDLRYAIDAGKIIRDLSWQPEETFESGIRKTVEWYIKKGPWWRGITEKNKTKDIK